MTWTDLTDEEKPSLKPHKVFIPLPVDDQNRPYQPEWAGNQIQLWLTIPNVGISLLVHQEPAPVAPKVVNSPPHNMFERPREQF